jgi:raffinose/stachyose/melibiose transport system permease protein
MVIGFLLPALLLYGIFVLYPITQSIRYSGYDWNGLEPLTEWVGLDNFREAFADPLFIEAIQHNFIIIGLSLALQIPFAISLAVLLSRSLKGRGLFRTMYFAPFILSEVVTGVVWRQIFRPAGLFDVMLTSAGAGDLTREWLADPSIALYSLFFVISWKYFGFHMVLIMAGLQTIPSELEEAAAIDGASWWQGFRFVTLPLLGPTIRVSMFLSIIGALQLFDLVWVTTKGGPVNSTATMATYLVDWGFRRTQFGYASAVSVIIFGLSLVIALLYQRFVLRRDLEGALTN